MFIQIEDNYLKMNRGDSYSIPLTINEGTKLDFQQYQLRQFDKIYIGIMEPNQSFENAIIRKVITILSPTDEYGRPLFQLEPIDTEYLLTGKYFIEIKIVQKQNNKDIVTTLLPLREFFINGTNKEMSTENIYSYNKELIKTEQNAEWESLTNNDSQNVEYNWVRL